ncbi:MAG: Stp1/IreP family PP2C-type Ser/Thr phosphatase [Clostridiales bacterium]|nr:Stp1/IreP family PP2C-type Ser/Thr phosphatase [Clostridiales bacterium]
MIAISRTHQGKVRQNNQDSLLIREELTSLYVVADGMGGHRGGNVASAMAVSALMQMDLSLQPEEAAFRHAFQLANLSIWKRQLVDVSLSGMGTTLSALWEGEDSVMVAHVGDSRVYQYADGILKQITQDHSLVGELLRTGAITPEMANNYPYRNIVTRAVGTDSVLQADIYQAKKPAGSRFVICSDGLTEYAGNKDLVECLELPLNEAADRLLHIALEGGGRDNITLIVLEVPA